MLHFQAHNYVKYTHGSGSVSAIVVTFLWLFFCCAISAHFIIRILGFLQCPFSPGDLQLEWLWIDVEPAGGGLLL